MRLAARVARPGRWRTRVHLCARPLATAAEPPHSRALLTDSSPEVIRHPPVIFVFGTSHVHKHFGCSTAWPTSIAEEANRQNENRRCPHKGVRSELKTPASGRGPGPVHDGAQALPSPHGRPRSAYAGGIVRASSTKRGPPRVRRASEALAKSVWPDPCVRTSLTPRCSPGSWPRVAQRRTSITVRSSSRSQPRRSTRWSEDPAACAGHRSRVFSSSSSVDRAPRPLHPEPVGAVFLVTIEDRRGAGAVEFHTSEADCLGCDGVLLQRRSPQHTQAPSRTAYVRRDRLGVRNRDRPAVAQSPRYCSTSTATASQRRVGPRATSTSAVSPRRRRPV